MNAQALLEALDERFRYLATLLPDMDVNDDDDADAIMAKVDNAKLIMAELKTIPVQMRAILEEAAR